MTIENTTKRGNLLHLAGAMSEGTSGYIEGMEAAGGAQMAASELLPTDLGYDPDAKERYETLGFTFGEVVADDPMFQHATIPAGWEKRRTDHSMWTEIVDERGLKRVGIFYKAAFYDRSAHMHIVNIGWEAVSGFRYGQPPAAIPWDLFTEAERAETLEALAKAIEDIDGHPDIYDKDGTLRPRLVAELAAHEGRDMTDD